MEAVPRLPMICFDLKVSHENASFGPKLKQYIADFYREDPESYNNEIYQLEGLRSAAVRPAIDSTGCAAMKRYFCQLKSLQGRFPMNKGQPAAVTFAWRDLFANIVCTLADVRFEMVCILYNIGALHSKLGADESRTTPESMKAACTHFQSAAWAFQYLREHYPQPSGIDLSPEVMKLFQDVCLAQAQECILEKSMLDNRKPSIVNAIGMQALIYYRNALLSLESSQTADSFQENVGSKTCSQWIKYLSFKVAYMSCVVYLFQGMQSEELQKMGERVSFYQAACDKLQEAKKLCKGLAGIDAINETLTYTNDIVEGKRKAAKNENEFIYHEEVPDKDSLLEPKPASLAKGIPINFGDSEVTGSDIFGRLIPMGAHEASSMYSEEKAKLLRRIIDAVETKDVQLNEFMSSLQLDQLNIFEQSESLPQELIDRCASLSVKTDIIENLVESMNNLSELHTEVESLLIDTKELLQEEDKNEKQYQKVMGDRQPSIVSTELSREANKYFEAHNKANESNQTLQKAMTLHLANLKILVLPLEEIQKYLPSIDSIKESVDPASIAEMKMLVGKVTEMINQRKDFVADLRESMNVDDITTQLLAKQGEPLEDIFKQEIGKHNKKVALIEQNLAAQENILKALTDSYAKYALSRKLISDVVRKRETSLAALMTSYDTYEDLMNKLLKGLEFYKKLSANVKKLHTRVKSTCKVQEEERSQLLATHVSKRGISRSTEGAYIPAYIPTVSKESSAPKLKDFLPYMKNRTSTITADTNTSDVPYSGQMYPPYVRPAPVGSEGTSDITPSNYADPLLSNPLSYHVDHYKSYQYMQSQPTLGQYSDQNIAQQHGQMYDSQLAKPDALSQINSTTAASGFYQKYDQAKSSDYKATSQDNNMSTTQYYPTATSATNSLPYGYNMNADLNTQQNTYQFPGQSYHPTEQYNQNYASYNPTFGTVATSNTTSYNPNLNQMMDNLSISSNVSVSNTYNPHPTSGDATQTANAIQSSISQPTDMYNNSNSIPQYPYNQVNPMSQSAVISQTPNPYASVGVQSGFQPANINTYGNLESAPSPSMSPYHAYNSQQPSQSVDQTQVQYGNMSQMYDVKNISTPSPTTVPFVSSATTDTTNISNPYYAMSPSTEQPPASMPFQSETSTANIYFQSQVNSNFPNQYSYSMSQNMPANSQPSLQTYGTSQDTQPQNNQLDYSQYSAYSPNVYNNTTIPKDASSTPLAQPDGQEQQHQYTFYNQALANSSAAGNPLQQYTTQESYQIDQNATYPQQPNMFQSNPEYVYNPQTGAYDYNYCYQPVAENIQQTNLPTTTMVDNSQKGIYTSAGSCNTVQTSSENNDSTLKIENFSTDYYAQYYSMPYGHQSVEPGNRSSESQPAASTNYDSNYANNNSLTYSSAHDSKTVTTNSEQGSGNISSPVKEEVNESNKVVANIPKSSPSAIDLLSGLDFSIDHKPLMPEIKVPPVSEHVIRKVPSQDEKVNPLEKEVPPIQDDVLTSERPPKRDIFSEPSLLNDFTQEVKSLQLFVDSFTKKTHSGITMLDSKWKKIQDAQAKQNSGKSTKVAKDNLGKNASPDVLPYDDTRVVLKGIGEDGYMNASHVKLISPWSIPMIVSDLPIEENYSKFWHMIYQEKVSIIVCLLTEIELQGKFYGPMTKSHKLDLSPDLSVTLSDIKCNVNWTKRKLIVNYKNSQHKVTHYQISVFPARIVSAPLVLLVDKILKNHEENVERDAKSKVLIHCSTGAGRSSLIVLLSMVMSQIRAGYIKLKDMLDSGFLYLCGTRTNVLEDTKYLVDIYRTVLFYVQGVLCSGTVMFSGEAVSLPSGASVPLQHIPSNPNLSSSSESFGKFNKQSFEEMKQAAGLKSGDMKDPLSYLDPLWSLKKRKE